MKKIFNFEKENPATKDMPFFSPNTETLTYYPHYHEEIEFIKCAKGHFEITTTDSNVILGEGEIFFFMPYEIHNIVSAPNTAGSVLKMSPIAEDIPYTRLNFHCKHIKKGHPAYEKMTKTLEALKSPQFPEKLYCATAVNELLLTVMQNIEFDILSESETKSKLKNIAVLDNVHKYLKANYMNKITLEDTAKYCALSKYYFSRAFKSIAGMCFSDYLTKYRLNKAIELMKATNKTQLDIAYECGFNSFQVYARSFERFFGMTPKRYKLKLNTKSG